MRLAHLAVSLVGRERGNLPLALGEVVERPQVDVRIVLVDEGGGDRESEDRQRDDRADGSADSDRGALEELRALVPRRPAFLLLGDLDRLRYGYLDRLGLAAHLARGLANPEEAEDDGEDDADHRRPDVHDQPEQDEGNGAGKGERPDRRRREVGLSVLVLGGLPRPL